MSKAAHALKLIQFSALAAWMWSYTNTLTVQFLTSQIFTVGFSVGSLPLQLLIGLALIVTGQVFNVAIYKAIGKNGVYYGNRFGAQLGPWCTGFPFNVPPPMGRHPQYFGVLCTIWGLVLICSTQAALAAGMMELAVVWTIFYIITSLIEQTEESTSRDLKQK